MKSLSEIETTVKRASRAIGFSWGISEALLKKDKKINGYATLENWICFRLSIASI